MIKALIGWGIGFGGVYFVVTHGLAVGAEIPVTIDQLFRGEFTPSAQDMFRSPAAGGGDIFR